MIPWRKSSKHHGEPAPRNAKRVLVLALGSVSEFMAALAAAKEIRHYHVGARITLMCAEPLKALAEKCPYFDVVETETALAMTMVSPHETTTAPSASLAILPVSIEILLDPIWAVTFCCI